MNGWLLGGLWRRSALLLGGVMLIGLAGAGVINQLGWLHGRGSIAFISDRDGNPEIYLMDIDRGNTRRLTHDPAIERRPAWSPDGRLLAFYSNRNGNWNIYTMTASGHDVRPLTQTSGRDGNLVWSADGSQLAFDSTRDGNLEIYTLPAGCLTETDACTPQRLTWNAAADRAPAWSPDGRYLLFESSRHEYYDIFQMDRQGEVLTRLTVNNIPDWGPVWSPDGQTIAFTSSRDEHWNTYLMDADCATHPDGCEANLRLLVDHPYDDAVPAWSPDGEWLVFESWIDDNWEVFMVAANGEHLQRLTFHQGLDNQAVWWP